jgi:6-phosphogluconolactonase
MIHRTSLGTWIGFAVAATVIGCVATRSTDAALAPQTGDMLVFIGTYTGAKSKGIYVARMNSQTGRLSSPVLAAETASPSFLALHPNGRFLYAVGELGRFDGKPSGALSAFAIASDTGRLTLLNQQSSGGTHPCHLIVDSGGRHVLTANYGSGSAAVLPIRPDGRLGEATAVVQHKGSSVHPQRQQGPHAHGIYLDAANRFAVVPDLGLDKVMIYRFEAGQGALIENEPDYAAVAPGAGPRHFAFHPAGRFGYVINELRSTVTGFAYEADRGALRELQSVSTLPEGFTGQSTTAEVAVDPAGRFLYGSNRGHDSIAVFAIDAQTGRLTFVERTLTQGKTPRNFAIDPTGGWLLAANQNSDSIVTFRIDPESGRLREMGHQVEVGAPVCVVFLRLP